MSESGTLSSGLLCSARVMVWSKKLDGHKEQNYSADTAKPRSRARVGRIIHAFLCALKNKSAINKKRKKLVLKVSFSFLI
jgi:hypothetical protein